MREPGGFAAVSCGIQPVIYLNLKAVSWVNHLEI